MATRSLIRYGGVYQFLFIALFVLNCTNRKKIPEAVLSNLDKSGTNKVELLKVLDRFQEEDDSLKLKAAYFLIANMDNLVHIDSNSLKDFNQVIKFYSFLIQQKKITNETDRAYSQIDSLWDEIVKKHGIPEQAIKVKTDLNHISSDYLIGNIERAYMQWQTTPWASHITFNQFCEYILPYNIDIDPLTSWRDTLAQKFRWIPDSLKNKASSYEVCILVCENLKWFLYNPQLWERKGFSPYGADILYMAKAGNCANRVNLNMYVMRSLGLAISSDYTPYWANRNWGHSWNSFIAEDGEFLDFEAFAEKRLWGGRMLSRRNLGTVSDELTRKENPVRMSKVLRSTFSKQKKSLIEIVGQENWRTIPTDFTNNRIIDVSDEYFPVSNIHVKLYDSAANDLFAYICTFNNNAWVPVHWGRIDNQANEVIFDKMGRNVLYSVMYFRNGGFVPASSAFILEGDGKIAWLDPVLSIEEEVKVFATHPIYRSDSIQPKNNYELFYWNGNWNSLGKKQAVSKSLSYSNVPANALLWLVHLDKKPTEEKERVFTMVNGLQKWW